MFADPLVGLAQPDAGLLRQLHQALAGSMHELRVGRKGDRLGLHVVSTMTLPPARWVMRPLVDLVVKPSFEALALEPTASFADLAGG
jgi:hypothetical protein